MSTKKIIDKLFSTSAAGLYLILFAAAIGIATFIENDFGTSAAQKVIFKSRWFELLLVLFGTTIVVNIFRFRMIQQKKWAILTFHAATIVILIGAGATRYLGSEGIMHIREGESSNLILTNETYLQFEINSNGEVYQFDEEVFFASLGKNAFEEQYRLGNEIINIKLTDFIPNPVEQITDQVNGKSILKVVMGGAGGREEYLVKQGDKININGILFNFGSGENPGAINIRYLNDSLQFRTNQPVTQMVMATQKVDTLQPGPYRTLHLRSLYTCGQGNFVISDFNPAAGTVVTSESPKMANSSMGMVRLEVSNGKSTTHLDLKGNKGVTGKPETARLNKTAIKAAYGAKYVGLPFSIQLRDFIMDRYPGTSSASSYASEVTLVDKGNNLEFEQRIFMNSILNYGGYRFFQSSFDQDELGTVLSVNHDAIGTWISYLGYFLLTLGMVLTLFSKKSRFFDLSRKLQKIRVSRKLAGILLPLLFFLTVAEKSSAADIIINPNTIIDQMHAASFGELVVQDHKGRMKPMNSLAGEILRKLSRKEGLYDQNADQIYLGMTIYPKEWADIPLIKISRHEEIGKIIGVDAKLATYNDFFKPQYLLRDQVRRAYNLEPKDRGTFEKELIKIDERVNICNLVFNGHLMRIFPGINNTDGKWLSASEISHAHTGATSSPFASQFLSSLCVCRSSPKLVESKHLAG